MLKKVSSTVIVRNFSRNTARNETDPRNVVEFVGNTSQRTRKKPKSQQDFTNLLVMDFEATCNRTRPQPRPQEIIEFPALNLCATTYEEVSRFHTYVRPDVHPQLSDFCTELTGIIQGMVDDQPNLREVLKQFESWLDENNLNESNTVPITYGDWDIGVALRAQCSYLGIEIPPIFNRWINLKYPIFHHWSSWPRGLRHSLEKAGLTFEGQAHSGIDDCVNIAALVRYLGQRNHVFSPTAQLRKKEAGDEAK